VTESTADAEALQAELARLRAQLEIRDRSARATHEVARVLSEIPYDVSEDRAIPRILEALAGSFGCTLAAYWVPAGDALACRATWCATDAAISWTTWEEASRRAHLEAGEELPGLAWRERGPARLDDGPGAEAPRRAALADAAIRSGVAFPVIAGGEVLGAIELFARTPAPPDDRCDDALRAIGDHVGQFVRYVRAQAHPRDDDERRTGVYEAPHAPGDDRDTILKLYDLERSISADLDPSTLSQRVAELATQLTGAQRGVLFYRVDGEELRLATSGISHEELARLPMPRPTPLLGLAFNSRETLRLDDVTASPRYGKNPPHQGLPAGHFPVRSYLAVPVRSRTGRISGALFLGHERPGVFDERGQRLAAALANHAATSMDNAALFAEQHRLIDALERTNTELDQFAYAASHDLRAPLRGIANLAAWIEEDLGAAAPEKVRDHLAMLKGRASRMDRLICGLLELARVGRARQRPERLDLTEVLHDTIDLLGPPSASRILIIGAMPTLLAERYAMQQVLLNLVGNAIQHAGKPDVVVRITSTERAEEIELSIADDGVGIPPELQAQCWEVFQTLQSRDVVDTPGIGLAIVKKQVEANGGRAWFVPRPKQGTEVRFTWKKRVK
jgi:signal transduction histidine kinase